MRLPRLFGSKKNLKKKIQELSEGPKKKESKFEFELEDLIQRLGEHDTGMRWYYGRKRIYDSLKKSDLDEEAIMHLNHLNFLIDNYEKQLDDYDIPRDIMRERHDTGNLDILFSKKINKEFYYSELKNLPFYGLGRLANFIPFLAVEMLHEKKKYSFGDLGKLEKMTYFTASLVQGLGLLAVLGGEYYALGSFSLFPLMLSPLRSNYHKHGVWPYFKELKKKRKVYKNYNKLEDEMALLDNMRDNIILESKLFTSYISNSDK